MISTEGYVITEHGGPEKLVWRSLELPDLAPDQVLVRVHYVGLNHLDVWVRRGVSGHRFPLPLVPGSDVVGEIESCGSAVTHVSKGLAVVLNPSVCCDHCNACFSGQHQLCPSFGILGETQNGGCARHIITSSRQVYPLPQVYSPAEMASFPLVFLTAWHMLLGRALLKPGETVLIQAAGSGVSSAAIQIAKHFGARVLTTVSSPEKLQKAQELGADVVIDYQKEDWVKRVREEVGRRGVDIALDHVGEATFAGSFRLLAKGGRLVTCGSTTGSQVNIDLRPLFFKGLSILGSTMGNREELHHLFKLIEQKKFKPVVDRILPWTQLKEAHQLLEERKIFGKVILSFQNP
jgi:NADPH:quinone reductase-like Zn-dependent oxidoreductase